jgi:hypothetical protein
MVVRALVVAAVVMLVATASLAGPQCKCKKTAAKSIDVMVCPIEMQPVKGASGGKEVVGKYTVHFCCAGCQPTFDKLSKADKAKKIAAALKKQNSLKKGKAKTGRLPMPLTAHPVA